MSGRPTVRMTGDEFLEWCEYQEDKYEFVDGVPVAMTGARQRHDLIALRALYVLFGQLRGDFLLHDFYPVRTKN